MVKISPLLRKEQNFRCLCTAYREHEHLKRKSCSIFSTKFVSFYLENFTILAKIQQLFCEYIARKLMGLRAKVVPRPTCVISLRRLRRRPASISVIFLILMWRLRQLPARQSCIADQQATMGEIRRGPGEGLDAHETHVSVAIRQDDKLVETLCDLAPKLIALRVVPGDSWERTTARVLK